MCKDIEKLSNLLYIDTGFVPEGYDLIKIL